MPLTYILALAAGGVGLVLLFGGSSSSSSSGPRQFTHADLYALHQLLLEKAYIGRELKLCIQKENTHSLFTLDQTLAFAVGLFTGVATLSPGTALKAARATSESLAKLKGSDVPCKAELQLTAQQLAAHDATCASLGLSKDVTYEEVQAIVAKLGGFTPDVFAADNAAIWNRCVGQQGAKQCVIDWTKQHNTIPAYDPKTGLAR